MTLHLRTTLWPPQPVLPPHIEVTPVRIVRTSNGVWLAPTGEASKMREIPVDFYLREIRETDYTDEDSLLRFANEWGTASDPKNRDIRVDQLPYWTDDLLQVWACRFGWLTESSDGDADLNAAKDTAAVELGMLQPLDQEAPLAGIVNRSFALARLHRELVNLGELSYRIEEMARLSAFASQVLRDEPMREDAPISGYTNTLNDALTVFAPRVNFGVNVERDYLPTAYSVAALQIANDLAENATIRVCQNEACPYGGEFTRQRGRARNGEYRTRGEVKYCSSTCAKSQAQRELRRRAKRTANAE